MSQAFVMSAEQAGPRISVVTISLNAARDLPLTIESVLAQDYPRLEYIVCDGQSWDGSLTLLQAYEGRIDRVVVREDAGIYHAMNRAIDDVTGDYAIFLNAGDWFFSEDAVSRMIRGLVGTPDIFYGNHIYVDGRIERMQRAASFTKLAQKLTAGQIDGRWQSTIPGHQATFASTATLRRLRFDTRLMVGADHELLFRAHADGAELQYIDETVAYYHSGGFSAALGERTRLEGASIYRRFSDKPTLIDRHFYPHGAPFDPQTARTGIKLCGFISEETRAGGRHWVISAGAQFLATETESHALDVSGFNDRDGQGFQLLSEGRIIAETVLPRGSFHIELPFMSPAPGGAIITIQPLLASEEPMSSSGISIGAFRFRTADSPRTPRMRPGDSLLFQAAFRNEVNDVIGSGWSGVENTHIWSLGSQSDLWLAIGGDVRSIRIDLSGNPHVRDGQRVKLLTNGVELVDLDLSGGSRETCEIDAAGFPWHDDAFNHFVIRPSATAVPPSGTGDGRELGVCLWSIVCD